MHACNTSPQCRPGVAYDFSLSGDSHIPHLVDLAHDLVGCALDYTTCLRQHCGRLHEVRVHVAGSLAAFIYAPAKPLAISPHL